MGAIVTLTFESISLFIDCVITVLTLKVYKMK